MRTFAGFYRIVLTVIFVVCMAPHHTHAAWMNPGWAHRKSHVVTSATGAGTNYPVRIVVHYGSGTDSGNDVYLGGNSNTDFSDIRFTDNDETTALDYWMESETDSSQAVFWVEIADDIGSSNATIYLYYGNSSATTASNGTNTFTMFDDFNDGSLDGSKWTTKNGTWVEQNGMLQQTSAVYVDPKKAIATGGPTGDGYVMMAKVRPDSGTHFDTRIGLSLKTNTSDGRGYNYLFHNFTTKTAEQFLDDGVAWGTSYSRSAWSFSTWYWFAIYSSSTTVYGQTWNDGSNPPGWNSWTRSGRSGYLALNGGSYDETVSFDDVAIRKIVSPEPTNSTWGAEENQPAPIVQSSNYKLKSYVTGVSGSSDMSSTSYHVEGTAGEQSGDEMSSTTYKGLPGYYPTQQANVPGAPTVTNVDSDHYNQLLVQIDNGANPTDTVFAIAISSDNFTTTQYVQSDHTVGSTLGIEDYQTYADWGGASGFTVIGLSPTTTYYFKVKAMQGDFTETGYGPTTNEATIDPYLTFDIDVASTDTETDPPFEISFGNLSTSVTTATDKIWVDFATNGEAGGVVYVQGTNAGLASASTGHTIASASSNLATASSGFGLQVSAVSETSGGPLAAVSPYDGSADNVGVVDTTIRNAVTTSDPIHGGRITMTLKAKVDSLTPAATDYTETITVTGSGSF